MSDERKWQVWASSGRAWRLESAHRWRWHARWAARWRGWPAPAFTREVRRAR